MSSTNRHAGLPPPLMVSEPGSFARYTIVKRKPQITQQAIEDNGYPPDIVAALDAFRGEIASQPVQPLHEHASDVPFWHSAWVTHQGKTWLELPWYFAETYFYRRLLEAVRYFVLRTLKGEIMVGLEPGQAEALAAEDPTWLINGKRGVIQFVRENERSKHTEDKKR